MTNAWMIHYSGSDTVGSVLERLERASKEHAGALLELGESVKATIEAGKETAQAVEQARELAEDARNAVAEVMP